MEDLHHRAAVNLSFSFRTPSISCLLPSFQEQLLTVETRTHERNHNIWTTSRKKILTVISIWFIIDKLLLYDLETKRKTTERSDQQESKEN